MEDIRRLKDYLRNPQRSSEEKVAQLLQGEALMPGLAALLQRQPDFDGEDRTVTVRVVALASGLATPMEVECAALRELMGDMGAVEGVVRGPAPDEFTVTYASALNAHLALYAYSDLELPELGLRLAAGRGRPAAPARQAEAALNKFTCRYDINIENDRQFEVSKRIIGAQGYNMKMILAEVQAATGCKEKEVKMRLRGRGSNFQEGPERRECDDKLHLCVSTKTKRVFDSTCAQVESLLTHVFDEYAAFLAKARGGAADCERHRFQRVPAK